MKKRIKKRNQKVKKNLWQKCPKLAKEITEEDNVMFHFCGDYKGYL